MSRFTRLFGIGFCTHVIATLALTQQQDHLFNEVSQYLENPTQLSAVLNLSTKEGEDTLKTHLCNITRKSSEYIGSNGASSTVYGKYTFSNTQMNSFDVVFITDRTFPLVNQKGIRAHPDVERKLLERNLIVPRKEFDIKGKTYRLSLYVNRIVTRANADIRRHHKWLFDAAYLGIVCFDGSHNYGKGHDNHIVRFDIDGCQYLGTKGNSTMVYQTDSFLTNDDEMTNWAWDANPVKMSTLLAEPYDNMLQSGFQEMTGIIPIGFQSQYIHFVGPYYDKIHERLGTLETSISFLSHHRVITRRRQLLLEMHETVHSADYTSDSIAIDKKLIDTVCFYEYYHAVPRLTYQLTPSISYYTLKHTQIWSESSPAAQSLIRHYFQNRFNRTHLRTLWGLIITIILGIVGIMMYLTWALLTWTVHSICFVCTTFKVSVESIGKFMICAISYIWKSSWGCIQRIAKVLFYCLILSLFLLLLFVLIVFLVYAVVEN